MRNKLKCFLTGIILLTTAYLSAGQEIKISENLVLHKLSDHCYVHTQKNNNGLIFINKGEALIVSTPDSDIETQNLIDWVENEQHAKIVGYVIDRWHPDAMEGLDIVHKNGIITYSYELTRQIAKEKGLPIPQIGFDPLTEIQVGNEKVICHYLGEAHTKDGIVIWIPGEQILFGGNEIRTFNGWVGNIGDASIDKWSETAAKVKNEYGSAKIVVPGHGNYGGPELIDYTIELYKLDPIQDPSADKELTPLPTFYNNEDIIIKADSDSLQNGIHKLANAVVIIQDPTKYAKVESPFVYYQPEKKQFESESGRLLIYDKTSEGGKLRTDVSYEKLILFKLDDSVGLRIILKGINK